MVRPTFPPRPPPAMGVIPPLSRPLVPGILGVPPNVTPVIRPLVPIVAPTEKPQTTVYVGKIAPTVENDFLLSILRLCGPVKSWKRAQDPTDGSPRGFGFCEFESAEGVLRALRLLSKFNVDGQELVLNVNQATREYLERYVKKKTEREKELKEGEVEGDEKEHESAPGVEKLEPPKPSLEDPITDNGESVDKENQDTAQKFGIVTVEDQEADRDALDKLSNMMEERSKNKPLPPPPPVKHPGDGSTKSNSEVPSKSRDADSDVDIMKSDAAEDKNDDETTSESKAAAEHDRPETGLSDKGRRYDRRSRERDDRRSRERDRERDLKREKERELERYERERERERVRREREREMKIREADRLYRERVKEWELREREKEHRRQLEKEGEKERERERWREIMDQEDESDDDDTRKRRRRSREFEERRKKRQREKVDDLADQLREDEEVAESKRKMEEDQQQKQQAHDDSMFMPNGSEKPMILEEGISFEGSENVVDQSYESDSSHANHGGGDAILRNDNGEELSMGLPDMKQNSVPARKLGFGIVGSGKRTTVPSVFHEEDDEDAEKEKKMRPLVPIDYSTEELQAVQLTVSDTPPNLVAAAEFAKRISGVNPKEERPEMERERNRRSNDRVSQRERDRHDEESNRARDENREKVHDKTVDRARDREHGMDKLKTSENKKLLDAKQLIDMIPKTKEELFSYDINWAVYDKHELHERMRPWISKKITEFLGEEEATLVDYIVSSTKEHVRASQMLELLQSILDDEAEMFVLKMWRMLIFEIKKVETGLSLKPKS
ncbi:RNA-binding motif protein 25-like isoform X2 [Tasmannia lanceolata]